MTKENNNDNNVQMHRPRSAPDGGWGWAVVVGGHVCIFLGVGWLQTVSIYLLPLQEEFGSSSATLGWIVSSGLATTFLSGPLGSISARKLGCRKSGIIGGSILGSGFVLSVFVRTPLQLFFTIGLITGVGCSLVHLSASIAISQYFTRRHALANGLAWLGSSIGQFISAPFLQLLIDSYGWRGAVMIEGGLVLNTVVAASLFRPLQYARRKSVDVKPISSQPQVCLTDNSTTNNSKNITQPPLCASKEHDISDYRNPTKHTNIPSSTLTVANVSPNGIEKIPSQGISRINLIEVDGKCISQCNGKQRCCRKSTFFLDTPAVLVVCVVNFLMAYAIQGYYAHVVAKAVALGISQDSAAFILSTYAIGSLIARLTHGWFVDRKLIKPLVMYASALSAGCVGTFSAVMASSYAGFLASAVVLGMSSGVFYPIIPVVMRDLVGLKSMGRAYGIAMVFDGTGVVTGGLMAGLIKDITGNYNLSFIQAGGTFALASACIWTVVVIRKCRTRKRSIEVVI